MSYRRRERQPGETGPTGVRDVTHQAESHASITTGDFVPSLLATGARTLRHHLGRCSVCGWLLVPGERAADLLGGRTVHAGCVAKAATGVIRQPGPAA